MSLHNALLKRITQQASVQQSSDVQESSQDKSNVQKSLEDKKESNLTSSTDHKSTS